MKKVGIFYGSTTGATEGVAETIAARLGVASEDIRNVGTTKVDEVDKYDVLLLGSSTWGIGELQDDWNDFLDKLKAKNLSGKTVAIFGCGDSASFGGSFCDAIGIIYSYKEVDVNLPVRWIPTGIVTTLPRLVWMVSSWDFPWMNPMNLTRLIRE